MLFIESRLKSPDFFVLLKSCLGGFRFCLLTSRLGGSRCLFVVEIAPGCVCVCAFFEITPGISVLVFVAFIFVGRGVSIEITPWDSALFLEITPGGPGAFSCEVTLGGSGV